MNEAKTDKTLSDKLFAVTETINCVCISSALWVLCSLPLVTAGAATTALYELYMRREQTGQKAIVKPFFTAFKEDFRQSTAVWLITLLLEGLFAVDIYYYRVKSAAAYASVLESAVILLMTAVFVVSLYSFALLARYENSVGKTLLTAAKLACRRWLWSLLALICTALPLLITALGLWQMILFEAGIICYANSRIMLRAFDCPFPGGLGIKKF